MDMNIRDIALVGVSAKLPEEYMWGEDAMQAFEFGKLRATTEIVAELGRLRDESTEFTIVSS